jgi:hypothetical protein
MGYLLYVLYAGTTFELAVYLSIVYFFGIVKSLYGVLFGIRENIMFLSYGIVYLCAVFPAKLWALFTIKDTSWGTSTRNISSHNYIFSLDIFFLFLWNSILLTGIVFNFIRSKAYDFDFFFLVTTVSIWILSFVFAFSYMRFQHLRHKKHS